MTEQNSIQNPTKKKSGSRLFALDLARLLAMLMMMQGHTIDALVSPQWIDLNVYPGNIWQFFRGLTAPIFLIVSGTVHVFAMKRDESGAMSEETRKRRMRWAWIILLWGYMLVFPANRLIDLPTVAAETWYYVFQVNILQLTAVTLMFIVWLSTKTYSVKSLGIRSAFIAAGIFIASPAIHLVDWFEFLPGFIGGFISYKHGSLFPLFPTSGFMFLGVAFGSYLYTIGSERREKFLKQWIFVVALAAIGGGIAFYHATDWIATTMEYYNPGSMIMRTGIILSFIGICAHLHRFVKRFENLLVFFSSKSLHIYILHLILLYGTPWFPSIGRIFMHEITIPIGIVAAALVVLTTTSLIRLETFVRQQFYYAYVTIKYTLAAMLAYALIV